MFSIQQVIETLNRLEAEGIIERYAIGGAVGATFYLRTGFHAILARYSLADAWHRFAQQFLAEEP